MNWRTGGWFLKAESDFAAAKLVLAGGGFVASRRANDDFLGPALSLCAMPLLSRLRFQRVAPRARADLLP